MPRLLALIVLLGFAASAPAAPGRPGGDPLEALLRAEFAVQSGDMRGASQAYLDAAAVSPDPAVAERAARLALHANELAAAEQALQRWQALAPDSLSLHQARAQLAFRQGQQAHAESALARLLTASGDEGWQRALQVLAAQPPEHSGKVSGVIGRLLDARSMPAAPDAWFAFGGLASRLQDDALAARLAAAAAQRFPDSPRILLWQAQRQRLAEQPEAARASIQAALAAPGAGETGVRLMAAAELDQLGDSAGAAAILAEVPQNPDLLLGRVAYLARAEDQDALAALYASLVEDPAAAAAGAAGDDTRFLLGQVAELLERHEEAIGWYGKVVGPRRSEAALREAVALDSLGRHDAARDRLREVQAAEQADGEAVRNAYLLEAELLLRRGQVDQAVAAYGRGLAIFEDDPQLLYARGLALADNGRTQEAEADLRRLIELDPDNADALNALGYTLADRGERLEEAHALIRRALVLAPDSAAVIDSLGWVLFRMGRAEEALPHLRRAFELQPDAEIAAHLGEVLWSTGAVEAARDVWAKGRAEDAENAVLQATVERLDRSNGGAP